MQNKKRRRKKKKASLLSNVIFIVSIVIFCVSAFMLIKYAKGYMEGRGEYKDLRELAIEGDEPEGGFRVDFEELMAVNPDTIGWIRFWPEPSTINYPLVQGRDNSEYLHKTFSENENTMGAIFLGVEHDAGFMDRNSIIYGHRMNDHSMFYQLESYKDKAFWEKNPYFYIYTPDGWELTYHIYSSGIVDEASDTYLFDFATDKEYQKFLDMTKETADYDTGIEVTTGDVIVTLSTCTSADDTTRYVVRGVLEKTVQLEEE